MFPLRAVWYLCLSWSVTMLSLPLIVCGTVNVVICSESCKLCSSSLDTKQPLNCDLMCRNLRWIWHFLCLWWLCRVLNCLMPSSHDMDHSRSDVQQCWVWWSAPGCGTQVGGPECELPCASKQRCRIWEPPVEHWLRQIGTRSRAVQSEMKRQSPVSKWPPSQRTAWHSLWA